MGRITLILGGARSGKSRYAQVLAQAVEAERGGKVVYLATARPGDREMEGRIRRHRRERPSHWWTLEVPREVASAVSRSGSSCAVMIVDCITLLISNLLLSDPSKIEQEIRDLIEAARSVPAETIVVSNEVGQGLVPAYALGRVFRDLAGQTNQRLAEAADRVFYMVAGLPQSLK